MALGAGRLLEDLPDRGVLRDVVDAARDQEQRLAKAGEAFGVPEIAVAAPRADGDDRLYAGVHQRLVLVRAGPAAG